MAQTVTTHTRRSSKPWWLLVALVVLAGVVVAVVLFQGEDKPSGTHASPSARPSPSSVQGSGQPQAHRVTQFSGPASTTTTTFAVALNWELRWTAQSASGFTVELLKADGTSRGKVVTAGSKTSGATFVGEAGTFKLKVTSTKPWTIQVFSRPVK